MSDPTASSLPDRLRAALLAARKARDAAATSALRSTLAAIENAEAVAVPEPPAGGDSAIAGSRAGLGAGEAHRRELSDVAVLAIVGAEVDDLRNSADEYERLGRDVESAALRRGADAVDAVVAGQGGRTTSSRPDR